MRTSTIRSFADAFHIRWRWVSNCGLTLIGGLSILASGCAVHYYDKQTGTEHLWGIGHLKMRAVPQADDMPPYTNAVEAYVTGVKTLGLSVGAGEDFAGLNAGWDSRSRVVIKSDNAHFYILWPSNSIWLPRDLNDFFTIRVGSNFPPLINPKDRDNP